MVHSLEECARRILSIMQTRNVRAGQIAMVSWFSEPFARNGWQSSDLDAGMNYAIAAGWILYTSGDTKITLTEAGEAQYA